MALLTIEDYITRVESLIHDDRQYHFDRRWYSCRIWSYEAGDSINHLRKVGISKSGIIVVHYNDINPNSNTNTYTNTGRLFRFGYEQVYWFLASVHGDTRRETQFLKAYANHTMLTPTQRAAHHLMFEISIHLCPSRSEKLNHTFNSRISTTVFSKSSNSEDHLFWAWRHPHSSPISCLGVYYDKWCVSYPLRAGVRLHQMTMHPD